MIGTAKSQIIEILKKKGETSPSELAIALSISAQALHRHLRDLSRFGVVRRVGKPPKTVYQLSENGAKGPQLPPGAFKEISECRNVLAHHPAVRLVTLFGSQARGEATSKSDFDFLVWLDPDAGFGRQDIWLYWDRHARHLSWQNKASLVVRKWQEDIFIDTLLLDFPEEHLVVYDRSQYFTILKEAIVQWRKKWKSQKLPSFGGKHAWKYSSIAKNLAEIDFRLELKDVA